MGTAKRITEINNFTNPIGVENRQATYEVTPPYEGNKYLFVSEAFYEVKDLFTIDETVVFPATINGEVVEQDYGNALYTLNTRSIEDCLKVLGYEIVE